MEDNLVCQENIYNIACYVDLMGGEDYNPWCVGDLRAPLSCACGIVQLTNFNV
jgi:hypothetical protein